MTLAEVQLMGNLWKMPWDADHLLMFDDANRLRRLGACKGFLDGKFHKDATACFNFCKYLSLAQIYFPCIDAARPCLFLSIFSRWSLTVAHWSLKMASRTMLRMLHSCVKLCKNLQIAGNSGLRLAKLMRRGCHNFVAMFSVQAIFCGKSGKHFEAQTEGTHENKVGSAWLFLELCCRSDWGIEGHRRWFWVCVRCHHVIIKRW